MLSAIFLFASFSSAFTTAANAATQTVLVTYFDPFAGAAVNQTQPIAAELEARASEWGDGVSVQVCHLPVVYDFASQVAQNCIAKVRPDVVLSLGEGFCQLQIESAATNWDNSGVADNIGQVRRGQAILHGAPVRLGLRFPVQELYCGLSGDEAGQVAVSTSPGAFVCNNLAYHLARELPSDLPYTFIHVPNHDCSTSQKDPVGNARTIIRMMRSALAALPAWKPVPMPSSKDGVLLFLSQLKSSKAPSCELEYAQRLNNQYSDVF